MLKAKSKNSVDIFAILKINQVSLIAGGGTKFEMFTV